MGTQPGLYHLLRSMRSTKASGSLALGLMLEDGTAKVASVYDDGQASMQEVKVGWRIVSIEGRRFEASLLAKLADSGERYLVTFRKAWEAVSEKTTTVYDGVAYLPKQPGGAVVLVPGSSENVWRSTNEYLKSDAPGIGYRATKDVDDCYCGDYFLEWDNEVEGVMRGSGFAVFRRLRRHAAAFQMSKPRMVRMLLAVVMTAI